MTRAQMTRLTAAIALGAAVALPGQTLAQEAAPEDPPAVETQPADGVSGDGLAMGTDVGAGSGEDATYAAATFNAWEQRCIRSDNGADPCQMYQLLKDKDGTSVAEFTMFGLPEGNEAAAGATFVAPLETLLTSGVTLQIDGGTPKAYPFQFCAPVGCVVRLGFTAEEVEAMKRGNEIKALIVPFVAQDARVDLVISLDGFTKAFDAVNEANAKADAARAAATPAEDAPAEE
jgi:invasion protein IalB